MDSIRIIITRDCDADGNGGTVADDATVVLGSLPDETQLLDVTAAAFAETFGLYTPDGGESVSPLRNISVRLREYAQGVVGSHAAHAAAKAAAEQSAAATAAALAGLKIVESKE